MQTLAASGRVAEAAAHCFCDPRVVRKWFQRFRGEGVLGLEDRKRSGRPRRVDEVGLTALVQHLDNASSHLSLRQLGQAIDVPTSTIHRTLSTIGLTFHSSARALWRQLGAHTSGWMELKGLAIEGHDQVLVFQYHPTLDPQALTDHYRNGGIGCCQHGLLGDPVRLFEVSDREHATVRDDKVIPFANTAAWLRHLIADETDGLCCLAWRPNAYDFYDLQRIADEHGGLQVTGVRGRGNWSRLVNPMFLYEKRGSQRLRPVARCWWRLTEAALHSLPTMQWSPGAERQVRQFSHYSGDYFPREAPPETDTNDLFESLLVTQAVNARRLYQPIANQTWHSPI